MDTLVLTGIVMLVWIATGFLEGTAWLARRTGLEERLRERRGQH